MKIVFVSLILSFQEKKDDFEYSKDIAIEIYTEGIKQNAIKIGLKMNNESIITYENFKNKLDRNIKNESELNNMTVSEKKLKTTYNLINKNVTGIIEIEKEIKDNIYMNIKCSLQAILKIKL